MLDPITAFDLRFEDALLRDEEPFVRRMHGQSTQQSAVPMAAYLVARLADRAAAWCAGGAGAEGIDAQLERTKELVNGLPLSDPDVPYLRGILGYFAHPPDFWIVPLQVSVQAYAVDLDRRGLLEESLAMQTICCRTYAGQMPDEDFCHVGLAIGRLRRLLARRTAAAIAYRAVRDAAAEAGLDELHLRARLGLGHVLLGDGELTLAHAAMGEVLAEAEAAGLDRVRAMALLDLALVLEKQDRMLEAALRSWECFCLVTTTHERMMVLGDLAGRLTALGAYETARMACELVLARSDDWRLRANARIELLGLYGVQRLRLPFHQLQKVIAADVERMPPSMAVDFHFKLAGGLDTFGLADRAAAVYADARCLALQSGLQAWVARIEQAMQARPKVARHAQTQTAGDEIPAVVQIREGLRAAAAA